MTELKKFTIEERVRWGDVDAAGIIFYGSYIRFFEIAETELFRAVGLPYGVVFDEQITLSILFVIGVSFPLVFYHHSWSLWLGMDHLIEGLPREKK